MTVARYRDSYGYGYGGWAPYVPVAERRRQAAQKMNSLRKKGVDVQPVVINGRKIASSFWGDAWCEHLESFSDYENRLPRGRTYVRNGSVCHLAVTQGKIEAKVSGSALYSIAVSVKPLPATKWTAIKKRCGGQIGSLLELLQGKLSDHVMEVVTDQKDGLFPLPGEISFKCSCPDWAYMCKHVAAVLYGVGARLDSQPELLFTLRGVNHEELIAADAERAVAAATTRGKAKRLATSELGDVFGIEIQDSTAEEPVKKSGRKKSTPTPLQAAGAADSATNATPPSQAPAKSQPAGKASAKKPRAQASVAKKAVRTKKVTARKSVVETPSTKKVPSKKKSANKPATKAVKKAVKKAAPEKLAAKKTRR